jgi:hypothetical protein
MSREIRTFDYVNQPYAAVHAALTVDAAAVIRAATTAASSHAASVAGELKVDIGTLQVSTPIEIEASEAIEDDHGPGRSRQLRVPISWKARERPGLFPVMRAELWVYPLTATETQLDFRGSYEPPLGALGAAVDAAIGHRIAEASVHRFLAEVARYLREQLSEKS